MSNESSSSSSSLSSSSSSSYFIQDASLFVPNLFHISSFFTAFLLILSCLLPRCLFIPHISFPLARYDHLSNLINIFSPCIWFPRAPLSSFTARKSNLYLSLHVSHSFLQTLMSSSPTRTLIPAPLLPLSPRPLFLFLLLSFLLLLLLYLVEDRNERWRKGGNREL